MVLFPLYPGACLSVDDIYSLSGVYMEEHIVHPQLYCLLCMSSPLFLCVKLLLESGGLWDEN
jgi:hypothetical protein